MLVYGSVTLEKILWRKNMKITDIKVKVLKPLQYKFVWDERRPPQEIQNNVVTVKTDEGIEGHIITMWVPSGSALLVALPRLKDVLVGRDPWDIEAIWHELPESAFQQHDWATSAIDICLWDILAKKAGVPLYKLLGAYRNRVRAYASTVMYATDKEFIDLVLKCREEGFTACKLHGYAVPDKDIRLCRAVREAVGPNMDLMLDPVCAYDHKGAFEVGRVLEELKFYWYEAPIPDTDIEGLVDLTRALDIQIAATEFVFSNALCAFPQYLTRHAGDCLRMIGDLTGGITAMRKAAHLCEAFNVKLELHSYGTTLVQAAHLNVMLAMKNCDFFEFPVPQGILDIGMKDVIRVAEDGYVYAPTKPGLGYDIDWDAVKKLTIEEA